jgi:hypothetical protein
MIDKKWKIFDPPAVHESKGYSFSITSLIMCALMSPLSFKYPPTISGDLVSLAAEISV